MKTIVLDKIASVTKSVGLKREVRLSATIPAKRGSSSRCGCSPTLFRSWKRQLHGRRHAAASPTAVPHRGPGS